MFSLAFFFLLCVRLSDLQASQSFEHYSISDKAMDYRILQMDEDQDRMYVGCKDHVLSMDINNITHGTLKVRQMLPSLFSRYHRGLNKVCKALYKLLQCCYSNLCKAPYICHDQDSFGVI